MKKLFYPFTGIFFIFLVMLLIVGYVIDIFLSASLLSIGYVFKVWRFVIGTADHISNSLETINDMIYSLREEAEAVLSKKQNKEKSNS